MERIEGYVAERRAHGLLRSLQPCTERRNGRIVIGERSFVDLSSNDYLGLSGDPRIARAIHETLDTAGNASCASRLLSGDHVLHHRLETAVAAFKQKDAALVFNSGYQANVGALSALCGKGDGIFIDRLAHASLIDGSFLSGAGVHRFRHNDLTHLRELLKKHRTEYERVLIVSETVFSMDGDRAPVGELVALKKEFGALLYLDEAHASGVIGPSGRGSVAAAGCADEVDLLMGTFSKAFAGFGAFIACTPLMKEFLLNAARSFVYSTALPAYVIAGNIAALEAAVDEEPRRVALRHNAERLRKRLQQAGLTVRGSTQIVPVLIGDTERTTLICERMREKGYWMVPIRPPTVPQGSARIRMSLCATHESGMLERMADELIDCSRV